MPSYPLPATSLVELQLAVDTVASQLPTALQIWCSNIFRCHEVQHTVIVRYCHLAVTYTHENGLLVLGGKCDSAARNLPFRFVLVS